MTSPSAGPLPEEPWELEVGAMLGRLPEVEPPAGFIDAALDRPPQQGGRVLAVLAAATVVALAAASLVNSGAPASVVPPVDELLARHDVAARAAVTTDAVAGEAGEDDPTVAQMIELPEGFQWAGGARGEGLGQSLYARGDESISVFVQDGPVDWVSLPGDRLTELQGLAAWVDADRKVAVMEVDGAAITIVGLSLADLRALPAGADGSGGEAGGAQEVVDTIVGRLGFSLADG